MLTTTCHCGAVTIEIPRQPQTITNCNCSICRRYGVLWAYYPAAEVSVRGATTSYQWGEEKIRFVRCAQCGCVTHWEPIVTGTDSRNGVNVRNFDPDQIGDARIRRLDGAGTEEYLEGD